MADPVVVSTQQSIPRTQIEKVFGDNPRMVKAIEGLLKDVSTVLPNASDANAQAAAAAQLSADAAADQADTATLAAAAAQATADDALALSAEALDEPATGALWAAIKSLSARIADLEQGNNP